MNPSHHAGLDVELIIHERIAHWSRQLRPRVSSWPLVIREARSADDVDRHLEFSGQAIVLIDLSTRAEAGVQALLRASEHHARPMILVLEPTCLSQNRQLTRELGATHVLSGVIVPPLVVAVLERWHRISTRRREAEGWYDGVVENSSGSDRAAEFESPFLLAPRPQ